MLYVTPKHERIAKGLVALTSGASTTLYEPSFFDAVPISGVLESIKASLATSGSASSIYRTADIPFFEATSDKKKLDVLLTGGLRRESECDLLFYPFISPLAFWWRMMDALWPMGIVRLAWNGQRLPFGLFRLWESGREALPHQDVLRREAPELPTAQRISRQFGVNLYLCNGKGGDLQVWDRRISDPEWKASGLTGSYGYTRDDLGAAQHVFSPRAGDMIMIDTECVHAITPVTEGERLTLSGFVGYVDDSSPLVCWS